MTEAEVIQHLREIKARVEAVLAKFDVHVDEPEQPTSDCS